MGIKNVFFLFQIVGLLLGWDKRGTILESTLKYIRNMRRLRMISDDAVIETCDEASKGYWGQGLVVMMQGEMISPVVTAPMSSVTLCLRW